MLARSDQAPNHTPQLSLREPHNHLIDHQTTWPCAKAQLWALLDAVESGDEVVITRRGKPVARLVRELREERVVTPGRCRCACGGVS